LSLSRLVLLPFFVLTLIRGHDFLAFLFLLVIGFTDVVDGYLARRYEMVSDLGKVLDHLGDKLVNIVVIYSLSAARGLPLLIFWIVAAREVLFILVGIFLAQRERTMVQSNWLGKTAGIVMFSSWILYIFKITPWNLYLLYVALATMLIASLGYLQKYLLAHKEA
jgi:cardiolipin synthase